MFGFLASPCARCTGSDYPVWRGVFCGLARCLSRDYGAPARVLVNRDAAFVGLLGLALDPEEPRWKPATCCNPLARPYPVCDDHPGIIHAAAVTICGLAAKLEDDRRDEKRTRRTLARWGRLAITPVVDRAVATLNGGWFPTGSVLDGLANQENLEAASPARADEPTAAAYAAITGHLARLTGAAASRPQLERAGSALGSLVYWRDAWDDRAIDARRGRFNPFLRLDARVPQLRVAAAWREFREALAALPLRRHASPIGWVLSATESRWGEFLQTGQPPAVPGKSKKGERKKEGSGGGGGSCCDRCDHPFANSLDCCCDCACDTGRGDWGCIGCTPGDGCCCGPGH